MIDTSPEALQELANAMHSTKFYELFTALAAEKRAAQAGVTDEIVEQAAENDDWNDAKHIALRAALEAVWPGKDAQDAKRYRWLRAWGIRLPEGARCYAQAALDNLVDGKLTPR